MDAARQTISEAYRAEQQKLHGNKRYGVASLTYAPLVRKLLKIGDCRSLSDYGAGKCNLKMALGLRDGGPVAYQPYDPAFPEYGAPRPADLVTCIDVLEHIEPNLLDNVLDEIASITQRLAFVTVHTQPAKKVLSDGRNAHLIQEPPSWWIDRLSARFEILHLQAVPKGFFVIAGAKGRYAELAGSVDLVRIGTVAGHARVRRKGLKRLLKALIGR